LNFKYRYCLWGLAIFIAISFSLTAVSASSLLVDESWNNNDIQNALDTDNNIDVLHFKKSNNGIYNNITLSINRGMNIVSDKGVVISGKDEYGNPYLDNAFNISGNNVEINGLNFTGYVSNIININNANNIKIINNIAVSPYFIQSTNVNGLIISNNTIWGSDFGTAISSSGSTNVNIYDNIILNAGDGISLSDISNLYIKNIVHYLTFLTSL